MAASNTLRSGETLVNELARARGLEGDADAETLALMALNSAIRMHNGEHQHWESMRTSSDLATADIDANGLDDLPSGWVRTGLCYLVNADGNETARIGWLSWQKFLSRIHRTDASGTRSMLLTAPKPFIDGKFRVWPTPSTQWKTDYPTIRMWYWTAIPLITSVSDAGTLGGPDWLEESVFQLGAMWFDYYLHYTDVLPFTAQAAMAIIEKARALDQDDDSSE